MDLYHFDQSYFEKGIEWLAGCDEAGRGPLAGPLVVASCMLPKGYFLEGVNDSKQLSEKKREALFEQIMQEPKILKAVVFVEPVRIDEINIYQATAEAMGQSMLQLPVLPQLCLVDGMRLKEPPCPCEQLIKGDARSQAIAAASILAKVSRDRAMQALSLKWPGYGFEKHKGYGTAAHMRALDELGPCEAHRNSFRPVAQRRACV